MKSPIKASKTPTKAAKKRDRNNTKTLKRVLVQTKPFDFKEKPSSHKNSKGL